VGDGCCQGLSLEVLRSMIRSIHLSALALAAFALGACTTVQGGEPISLAQAGEYRIGPGDDLRIAIYGEPNLSAEYHVSPAGKIAMPLVGDINAQGLTVSELGKAVAEAYKAGKFLTNPVAAVDILNYRPFFVLGEVNSPGSYPYVPGMTMQQAVATAKGYTYRARKSVVVVTHWGQGAETTVRLEPGAAVLPGDTIRVLERHF